MREGENELYQQMILDHNKNPRNFKELENCSHKAEGYNPLCGDHLWVYLKMDDKGTIVDVTFKGEGCAISKASASLMTTYLKGKSREEVAILFKEFQKLVTGALNPEKDENHLGRLKVFSGIWHYPSRVKCAALAWHAMKGALEKMESVSTE